MIYRVMVKTTSSLQPGCGGTTWVSRVIYCGPSLVDARTAFLGSRPNDEWRGHGNRASETVIEKFESEPEEIDSEIAGEVEVE